MATDPLIISVKANFIAGKDGTDTRMRNGLMLQHRFVEVSNLLVQSTRSEAAKSRSDKRDTYHRERRREKAESVDDMLWNGRSAACHASYVLANVLSGKLNVNCL